MTVMHCSTHCTQQWYQTVVRTGAQNLYLHVHSGSPHLEAHKTFTGTRTLAPLYIYFSLQIQLLHHSRCSIMLSEVKMVLVNILLTFNISDTQRTYTKYSQSCRTVMFDFNKVGGLYWRTTITIIFSQIPLSK